MGVEVIKKGIKDSMPLEDICRVSAEDIFRNAQNRTLAIVNDTEYWKLLHKMRTSGDKRFSKNKTLRHIASIPPDLYNRAIRVWGPEIFRDPRLFKKYFIRDPLGELTLVVPKDTI